MAVQKSRRTRSTRGMRRAHDKLSGPALSIDPETGETHLRHHVTSNGYYRGQEVVPAKAQNDDVAEDEAATDTE